MDASKSDVDFDSYWEEEARNPNRNRIRIGRQYQAQVTPLLQPGEIDGRKLEDLETLSWNPENSLSGLQLQQYFAIAKAIGLFVQAVDTCHEGLEDDDDQDQEERPFEILQLGPNAACEETNSIFNTGLSVTTPEKQSITTRQQRLQLQRELQSSVDSEPGSSSPLKHTANVKIQNALKGLPAFISSHHSVHKDKRCKFGNARENTEHPPISLGTSENYNAKRLSDLLLGEWTANEAQIFARALQVCGKNFSAIKKDYLPWKSVRSIIEFYYCSVDQEGEQPHRKKAQKSPVDEGKRKRSSRDSGSDSNSSSKSHEKVEPVEETNNNNGNSDNGASLSTPDSQTDSAKCSNRGEDVSKDAALHPSDAISLVKSNIPKNGFLVNDVPLTSTKASYGNINGNHVLTSGSDHRRNHSLPGQEVKPLKAKPIVQNEFAAVDGDGGDGLAAPNSFLGSLNLYLHGELVLKLNAQQQEADQTNVKWVESMEASSKKKRHTVVSNGLSSSPRLSGLKRSIDSKVTQLFKEDLDDLSTCGGDVSGSDDDSGSDASSSLVASSPSSSSTINSAAKKARVKVENLSNGPSISPPNSGRKSDSQHSNGKQRTVSPSVEVPRTAVAENVATDLELQKKILEANLGLLNGHLPLLFAGAGVGGLFEPPRAHSNQPQYPPSHPLHVAASASPVKTVTPKAAESSSANGHVNGVSATGPVDLTRKLPSNGHCSERLSAASHSLHSPSSRRSPSVPKAAHESTTAAAAAALSPSRLVANSLGLFSLPALPPPPTTVSASPNGHTKHLKKPLIRTGGVQFAK